MPLLTLTVRNGPDASALSFKNQQTPPSLLARAAFAICVRGALTSPTFGATICTQVCENNTYNLSVDNLSVLVFVRTQVLAVLVHGAEAHTHVRETTIVEERLHGNLTRKVAEKGYAIVCAL